MAKLKALQDNGVYAYPVGVAPSLTVALALETAGETVTVAGRVLRIRDYGSVLFADLRDWSAEVQLLLDNSRLSEGDTADFTKAVDLGHRWWTRPVRLNLSSFILCSAFK
jgi:lysyl-tRNA synthetase class 2